MSPARGIERTTQRELNGELDVARGLDASHVRACADCMGARTTTTDRCEAGWELAKRVSRAESAVRRWKERKPADQLTLFDVEG